jgi:hypothetical protein
MPLSAEIPAPVKTVIRLLLSLNGASSSAVSIFLPPYFYMKKFNHGKHRRY